MKALHLTPSLGDVSYDYYIFQQAFIEQFEHDAFYVLMLLVSQYAASRVWTYTPPNEGGWFTFSEESFRRSARVSASRWREIIEDVSIFFERKESKWRLRENWVKVRKSNLRPAISAALRSTILNRDNFRCGYCGTTEGPFHCDHIIPVSRGGATDEANLLCACVKCNSEKRAKTPEEWLA